MTAKSLILAIDQGTTSTRAMLFDADGQVHAMAAEPLTQGYPRPGWVEHDAEEIWRAACAVAREVVAASQGREIAALGITNQRETTVLWERDSGTPLGPAIVWQDRRTGPLCQALREKGLEDHVRQVTGLEIDPYFSATKIAWMLEESPDLKARAAAGDICFGTIESWLIFKLTGARVHASDASNASRSMLYDIHRADWDAKLLEVLDIPRGILPEVRDCQADWGEADAEAIGCTVPIAGAAGDQQAALYGQACFSPGMIKATYGTGAFLLVNTGTDAVPSKHRMLTTIAYRLDGATTYALEGAIFMAGATIQWLRDSLGLFADAAETEAMARAADAESSVHLVPAFQGLGAPHWDAEARGAILGLTRAAGANEIVRAGLEAVAFQTRELVEAMATDMASAGLDAPKALRVDGGMTANSWAMQTIADMTGLPVEVARIAETTALGAAYHAGLQAGLITSETALADNWQASARFVPALAEPERARRLDAWKEAVERTRSRPAS